MAFGCELNPICPTTPTVAYNNCMAEACFRHCVYCSGGGAPGGECNSDGDCNLTNFVVQMVIVIITRTDFPYKALFLIFFKLKYSDTTNLVGFF